ncbi:hypothetical protein HNR06_002599 [Nocardiopsis arvandica]|uniref:Uncharacterized protein n=1 Tax=Nocardiopsis sinuspersici TaxID=501010 RepID=A0A7Z0BKC1_9ACTN|nr:hypothetical protein [Nocardiopsis sinuspersici]NYH53010.1 hypothetical protein [Nocardiopsis sinuspersici]
MLEQGAPPGGRRGLSSDRPGVLVRLVLRALVLAFPLALLLTGTAHADEVSDKELDSLSFYRLSSSMTALFSTAQEPGSDISLEEGGWNALLDNPASAGSMLGYADEEYNPIAGWLNSRVAQSSDSVGYQTLVVSDESGLTGQGAREYALFGAALNGLGLDSTSTGLSLGFFNAILGGIVFILFTASAAVDALWSILIDALVWLNPFKLFYTAILAINPVFANGMVGGEGGPPGFLTSLSEWIGSWYLVLVELSWTVMVPLFIGVFLMSILLFKQFDKGSGLKKLFIRLFFIGLGLPLLGSMYTGMLNAMDSATDEGNSGATRVVLSTYVDFESWAMDHRLRVPSQEHGVFIEWDHYRNAPSGRSQASVRDLALLINAQVLNLEDEIDPLGTDPEGSWGESALGGDESAFTETQYAQVAGILRRYMSNAHVSASSFETESKSSLPSSVREGCEDGDDECTNVRDWFKDYIGDPKDVVAIKGDGGDRELPVANNPLISVDGDSGLTVYRDRWTDTSSFYTRGDDDCGLSLSTRDGLPRACNLAPLAMYNYLNTDFGPTSYTSYSSGRSTSEATRSIHNSVSMVGTGTMSFVYWFNAVVLLGAFVTIGFGYAVAMLIGNIRRSFQLITAIPFATLGAISGIAKVIVYSIALIMEVVVTLFLYKFVQEFLLSIPSIIEIPFSQVLNNGDADDGAVLLAFLRAGGFITMIVTLVTIIVVIVFTVMAMRLRKTLVKAVEEASTKLVEKLTDSSVTPPGGGGGGGKLPALASGASSGAGAAMGNRMMGGGGGPKSGKGPNAGGTNGGPEGISTSASNSNDTRVGGDVDTDGILEGPGEPTSGDGADDDRPGAGLDPGGEGREAERETELGRRVETDGLSMPPGSADPDNPRVGDDADLLEVGAASVQESDEAYRKADAARLGAGKDGVEAGVHAGGAVIRGFAGDPGAAESGGKALEKTGSAAAKNAQANEHKEQAGKSSLDNQNPNPKNVRRMNQGEQMQQTGRTVSDTAGLASGGTGGKPGGGGPKPTGGTGGKSGGAPKPTGERTGNSRKPRRGNNRKK